MIKRNQYVEIGQVATFNYAFILFVILLAIAFVAGYFGSEITSLEFFAEREEPVNGYFIAIIALPQAVQFVLGIVFKEVPVFVYLTDQGILTSMNLKESFEWNDFESYKILPDLTLFRFRKKNPTKKSKFFFVSFDKDHLKEHEEEILSILEKKLKSEHQ